MPKSGVYSVWSALPVPVVVDSVSYTHAVRWLDPNARCSSRLVVSGVVYSVESLGGDSYKLVLGRGVQFSSYPIVNAGEPNIEVTFPCACGGNVVQAPECFGVISHANSSYAHRGLNRLGRIPRSGSVVKFPDSIGWSGLTTEAVAYGEAPEEVNWNPSGEDQGRVWSPDLSDLGAFALAPELTEGVGVFFEPGSAEPFDDVQVFAQDSGTMAVVELTREVFDLPAPVSSADEYYLPPRFEFSAADRYWFHPDALDFRFPSGLASFDSNDIDTILARYYLTGQVPLSVSAASNEAMVVVGSGTGYGSTDNIAVVHRAIGGDFDEAVMVTFGEGSFEWRYTAEDDSSCFRIDFEGGSGDLATVQVAWRATAGGAWSTSAGVSTAADPLYLRIVRSSTSFTAYWSTDGAAWTSMTTQSLTDPEDDQLGFLGVATTGTAKVLGVSGGEAFEGEMTPVGFGVDVPTLYALRSQTTGDREFEATVTLPFEEAVTEVYNVTADIVMGQTMGGTQRDGYDAGDGELTFFSESSGDVVRVTHAQPASVPDAPGRPPRERPNQTNLATSTGDGSVGTTVVSENHLNWRDYVVVTVEGYVPVAGERVEFWTLPIFSPDDPPVLEYRTSTTGSWTALGSNHLSYWVDGLTLLRGTFMDGLGGAAVHLRARDDMFVNSSSISADELNYQVGGVEAFDEAAIEAGVVASSDGDEVSGTAGFSAGISDYSCGVSPAGWRVADVDYGLQKNYYHSFTGAGNFFPFWSAPPLGYSDTALRLNLESGDATTLYCPSSPDNPRSDHGEFAAGDFAMDVVFGSYSSYSGRWAEYNFESDGMGGWTSDQYTRGNYFGCEPSTSTYNVQALSAGFGFTGHGVRAPEWFQNLPDGTTVVSARLRVKFTGLVSKTWSGTYEFDSTGSPDVVETMFYEQGELVSHVRVEGASTVTNILNVPPEPSIGDASMGFVLMGRELNTEFIELSGGGVFERNNAEWVGIGGGVVVGGSGIENDKWQIIEAKSVFQALLDDRDSKRREYQLWPTNTGDYGGSGGTGEANGLAMYLASLLPKVEVTGVSATGPGSYAFTATASGAFTCYSTLTIGSCVLTIRLASGELEEHEVFLQDQEAMIGAYE